MIVDSPKAKRRLTIKDIAELAGVSRTAVSGILNQKPRVCKAKQEKVLDIIRKYDYVPQVAARTLSTRRTYQIGYLVSAKATLGLANDYFATIQAGVGEACKKYGYQMVVSTYDLSSIKNFVMPEKLKQRSVDALVIAGIVNKDVLQLLKSLNIPYIIIDGKYTKNDLYLHSDMVSTYVKIIEYFASLGHKLLGFDCSNETATNVFKQALKKTVNIEIKTTFIEQDGDNEFVVGVKHAQEWLKADSPKKYTAIVTNSQICAGFLSELLKNNIKCPEEISVMASSDTTLCAWNSLPISASSSLLEEHGFMATKLLIELLDKKKNFTEVKKALLKCHQPHELIIRTTTGEAPQTGG